ncbi:hypothetical protein [Streptomyces chilikensis]|uniref:Uncharacterized protein n=1 Tax=Streptomyces chilikensis TaxID=1194079 RepID=A0ABV3EJD5_9ACTN
MYRFALTSPGKPAEHRTGTPESILRAVYEHLLDTTPEQLSTDDRTGVNAMVAAACAQVETEGFAALQLDETGRALVIRPATA